MVDLFPYMTENEKEVIQGFKERLTKHLLSICKEKGYLGDTLLQTPDIEGKWTEIAPDYYGDAIPEFNGYPEVVLAWAAYLGEAVAQCWDSDWTSFSGEKYGFLRGARGFDYLDEHITEKFLGYKVGSEEGNAEAEVLRDLATQAYTFLRHDNIEAQSILAYKAVLASIDVMFLVGAAVRLKKLGYKFEKM